MRFLFELLLDVPVLLWLETMVPPVSDKMHGLLQGPFIVSPADSGSILPAQEIASDS